MKFTIEINDFWVEDDYVIESLTHRIKSEVIDQINAKIKDKIDIAIGTSIQEIIEKELRFKIDSRIAAIVSSETITINKREVLIVDYIKETFTKSTGWNNPIDLISRKAKEFGEEMKKRYDYLYANQIVQQMHKIGIIKEEVFNNLIEQKDV